MSWSLASFVILGGALAAGFAWYERAHPSARLVAVAGTLAALAILGRIAFAPIPNVKPTTDVVFIAGWALGGAPGFVVGAVTALGSNLFFGQGPWTPWQMGAWGTVGLLGAGLAVVSRRRLGRLPLALACGGAGLLYGAILDLSVWTVAGRQTIEEYVTIAGISLPFNIAHAVGNVVFFLAFGPALIRAVERCRARFDVAWQPVVAGALALLVVAAPERAQAATPVQRAAAYLEAARNPDGGWGGAPGQSSNGLHTAWAAYAMAAAGEPVDVSEVLVRRLGTSTNIGDVERTILGLVASGADPRDAGGRDLVAELLARQRSDGSLAGYTSFSAYGTLALTAAGETRGVAAAARFVARQANRDGGFTVFRRGGPSSPDDTAGAIEALVAAGRGGTRTVRRAVAYLRRVQRPDGGYALSKGAPSNAQSASFAILGLTAAGVEPENVRRKGRSAVGYLRRLQAADGSFRYSRSSAQTPVWVTAQATLALTGTPLPVRPASDPPPAPPQPSDTRGVGPVLVAVLGAIATRLRALL